ncbi:AT-rich interactive domain-containing protein 5-like isoform X2 [Mercurialis annua]|uniref:AT-rich interactive domain-containing protein 5-like isoform X2 n=1 Tax=Mercurialis annua TaxID=3986 RepID=UPI00216018BC|nr:AT-rich interactive domain-containing protein 5-like isoform X2 [Mercurialis annua]
MDNAKENEDDSIQPLPISDAHQADHPVPLILDEPISFENQHSSSVIDVAVNHNNAELEFTLPQSQSEPPSMDNDNSESKSSPHLSHPEPALLADNKADDHQQLQTDNSADLKTNTQQPEIESALSINDMELNPSPQQHQAGAVADYDNEELKTSPQKPQIEAVPRDEDCISSPLEPQTETTHSDSIVELKPGPEQPHQGSPSPAPSDDNRSLLKPEIEPPTEENNEANENSDCKTETCGVDGSNNSTINTDTAKLTADAKSEPSQVPENGSDHHTDTTLKEHDGPDTPLAEAASIKAELDNKEELENGENKEDTASPKINGSSTAKHSFLLGDDHDGSESGTEEEQWAFMKELEIFFRERSIEFKPPKFYGEGLNCLKLWRSVMRLGGYDKVTSCKFWRQVGESFKPPKTCTTVSWTFRGFYEKTLLDYERHKTSGGELILPVINSEPVVVDNQTSGSGRARRDAAARAMQGWHSRLLGNGEEKDSAPLQKRDKQHKTLGLLKRKKPSYMEDAVKAARAKTSKPQLDVEVVDLGVPADWVKINVQRTKDCFEVYALVPGLLREEVRVQSDPAGRLVISGEPEHPDNPWGVTPFKKVVSLPSRIDPHQTSAVVTLHGQLFVRVPFEHSG